MAKAVAPAPRVRRTQEERSATTRKALLEATVECLIELGYSDTTTTVIAERAKVSRGAQLHHFPTKFSLVAAALDHLAHELGRRFAAEARGLDSAKDRVGAALDALWAGYATPLFSAWLELSVAARTDPELRAELLPLEARLRGAVTDSVVPLFGVSDRTDRIDTALRATLHLLQGMALEEAVGTTSARDRKRNHAAVLALWKDLLRGILAS
jgi:AcrR family transcriptional regulator